MREFPVFNISPLKIGDENEEIEIIKSLDAWYPDTFKKYEEIRKLLGFSGSQLSKFVRRPIINLALLCNSAPASEYHHDFDAGGLFRHSLDVGICSLKKAIEKSGLITPPLDSKDQKRFIVSCWFIGLVHDTGKIFFLRCSNSSLQWENIGHLTTWLLKNKLTSYEITHFRQKESIGFHGHEPMAIGFLPIIIPQSCLIWLGSFFYNAVHGALVSTLGAEDKIGIYGVMKEADHFITGEARKRQKAGIYPDDDLKSIEVNASNYGMRGLVDDFIGGFREVVNDPKVKINVPGGHIFLSRTHTVLVADEPKKSRGIFRIIFDCVSARLKSNGYNGSAKAYYNSDDPYIYLRELEVRIVNNKNALGLPCSIDGSPDVLTHQGIIYENKDGKKYKSTVIVFNNKLLWGSVPWTRFGEYQFPITLLSRSGIPSLDPEEIGFIGYSNQRKSIQSSPSGAEIIKNGIPSVGPVRIDELEPVTRKIWGKMNEIYPNHNYKHIESVLSQQDLDGDHLCIILESVLDRLRGLTGNSNHKENRNDKNDIKEDKVLLTSDIHIRELTPSQPSVSEVKEDTFKERSIRELSLIISSISEATEGSNPASIHNVIVDKSGQYYIPVSILEGIITKSDFIKYSKNINIIIDEMKLSGPHSLSIYEKKTEIKNFRAFKVTRESLIIASKNSGPKRKLITKCTASDYKFDVIVD